MENRRVRPRNLDVEPVRQGCEGAIAIERHVKAAGFEQDGVELLLLGRAKQSPEGLLVERTLENRVVPNEPIAEGPAELDEKQRPEEQESDPDIPRAVDDGHARERAIFTTHKLTPARARRTDLATLSSLKALSPRRPVYRNSPAFTHQDGGTARKILTAMHTPTAVLTCNPHEISRLHTTRTALRKKAGSENAIYHGTMSRSGRSGSGLW